MDLFGMDLEQYRLREGLTYAQLAERIRVPQSRTAQAYALGELQPGTERAEQIIKATDGMVTLHCMHKRRLAWLREHNRLRYAPAIELPAGSRGEDAA